MDQQKFLQQMADLIELGRTKENLLTKEEVDDYCSDLNLTEEQQSLVYAYLSEHNIEVAGAEKKITESADSRKENKKEDSKYLKMYWEELEQLPVYTDPEREALFLSLRGGEEGAVASVVEAHLSHVAKIADQYKGRGVLLEDLIQEANLELMTCVNMLCGNQEVLDYSVAIDHAVKSRLIELVDEQLSDDDSIHSVVARMNLLLEATRALAEEYGRVATMEELVEFTHMDRDEIQMYVDFSKDKIELGQGE